MMYLFIIKVFIIHFMHDLCNALSFNERGAEFLEENDVLTTNESSSRMENSWSILLHEQPVAVLLESRALLLEKLHGLLNNEKENNALNGQTVLATFNSSGLQNASLYNDTEFSQAIMELQPTIYKEVFSPAIHALAELLQRGLPEGSILLVTMSKPTDENFLETLMRSLTRNKNQLSVLWAGDQITDDYILLKNITARTGGKFKIIPNDSKNFFSEGIKFPEDQNEYSGKELPLVSRVAEQRVLQKAVVPMIVEVASGTSLETRPGTPTQIQFNVKNNMNVATPVFFNAKYNGIVQIVQPPQTFLQPFATVTVTVTLQPTGAAQNINAVGTVTLFAVAGNKVTARSALVSLTPQSNTDNSAPKMTYKYEGDCSNYKEPQNCDSGHWSLEATLHDEDSGLLKILSEPYGLFFQSEFVAGTKSPVTVYYSATCCQPNAYIWAEDLKGNYVKKTFDVFNQNLLAGEIASIALGILLFLFIILAVVAAIVFIKRRNQRNMIIPRARSGSR